MTVHQQLVSDQGFLECGRHERVTRAGVGEDSEVDPEEDEVEDKRNDNEANHSGEEVLGNAFLHRLLEKWLFGSGEVSDYVVGFLPI